MNYDIIGGIVDQKALDQLKEVEKIANNIAIKLRGVTLGSMSKEADAALVQRLNAETAKLITQEQKLQAQIEKTSTSQQNKAKNTKILTGYINELEQEVKQLAAAYSALSKAELEGTTGQKTLSDLKGKREELAKLKAAYGDMRMNVGNYSSATKMLGINIGQVMKEMPNFAISARIGIMSLTNNLPMLAETIKQVRVEQLAMIAAGKSAPSMFSLISKSVFGLTGVMSVLMVLMQIFGADIIKWVGELFKGEKAFKGLTNAELGLIAVQQTLNKSMKDGGGVYSQAIGDIEKMTVSLKASKGSKELAKKALDDYNNSLGVTFGKAQNVDQALKLIKDNEKDYIKAMQNMAFANAFFNQSADDMTKIVKTATASNAEILGGESNNYIKNIDKARKRLEEGASEWVNTWDAAGNKTLQLVSISRDRLETELNQAVSAYNNATKTERARQIAEIQKNQNMSLQQADKYYKKYAQLYKDNDWTFKENESKSAKDKVEKTADINSVLVDIDAKMYDDLRKNFDEHIKDMLKQMDDNQKFIEAYQKLSKTLKDTTISGWVDSEGDELDKWLDNIKKQKEAEKELDEIRNESAYDTVENLIGMWQVYFDFISNAVDEQLEKDLKINNEKIKQYEDETDAGMHTKAELSDYQDRMDMYRKSQEEQAAKDKEEIERNSFLVSQALAVADIWIKYAQTNAAILVAQAVISSYATPIAGKAYAVTAKAMNLASAVAGTALAAAQTIPYFAEGGIMENQGMAVLGDAYKHELAITPSGQYFVSDNKPTMYNLEKGTQILPDINRMDLASILALRQVMPEMKDNVELLNELKKVTSAVKSQKHGNFYGMPLIRQIENRNKYSSRSKSLMN